MIKKIGRPIMPYQKKRHLFRRFVFFMLIFGYGSFSASDAKTISSATVNPDFVVWTDSPYIATDPSAMPSSRKNISEIKLQAAINEYEHFVLNVTNLSNRYMEFQVSGQLPGQIGRPRSGLCTSVQRLQTYQPKLLKMGRKLPEKEDGLAMPLLKLNELETFFVRPHTTRQLWFTVHTRGMIAGSTMHTLQIIPRGSQLPAVDVFVEMTVWNFQLENEAPIGVFCFDYGGDYNFLKSYKINIWLRGAFPPRIKNNLRLDSDGNISELTTDIKGVKRRMAKGARKFLFSYGYTGDFIKWAQKNHIEYMSDHWKSLFKRILSQMVKEWREAGLKYENFALQTIDEAHDKSVEQVIETTPLIREVDPDVRTAMTIMTDIKELKRMAIHVDVWINRNGAIWNEKQRSFFQSEKALGKPIWSWNMPSNLKSRPLTDFRTYGWRAMKFDFDAIGFFLYYGVVYNPQQKGGGIATRHWEAWRDGIEDYQYLWTLKKELLKARQRSVSKEKLQSVEQFMSNIVDKVITAKFFPSNDQATHDRIQTARALLAKEIERVAMLK